MSLEEINKLGTEMRETFEVFKKSNDQRLDEIEKRGTASPEAIAKTEETNKEITELRAQLDTLVKQMQRPASVRKGMEGKTPEQIEAIELRSGAYDKFLRYGMGENSAVELTVEEKRSLAGTSDSDGQFLVPEDMENNIIIKAANVAEVRPLVQVGTTSRDAVKMGSLARPVVSWGTRGLKVDIQDLNSGGLLIPIKNVRALTLISNDTLEDSAANIVSELEMMFQDAVAEAEDDAFMVGADPDSPKGILSNVGVQALAIASLIADAISDSTNNGVDQLQAMLFALKKKYRRNSTWAMNSTTEGEYRKLKSGDGKYLWDPTIDKAGAPTLFGRPVVNPEGMPDIAANAFPVILGDFRSGYKVRDRSGLTITRLVERYAEYDQTGFLLKKRVGGGVALAEAFVPLKIATSV